MSAAFGTNASRPRTLQRASGARARAATPAAAALSQPYALSQLGARRAPRAGYTAPLAWQAAREAAAGGVGAAGEALAGVAACLGLSAYVTSQHVPERWHPGRYDLVGQSHQARGPASDPSALAPRGHPSAPATPGLIRCMI